MSGRRRKVPRIAVVPKTCGAVWLGLDGKYWRRTTGFAKAIVPVRSDAELEALTGLQLEEVKPELLKVDFSWMPSIEQIGWLRKQLLKKAKGREAMVVLLRSREEPRQWAAVVPKQETTTASFDAPELKAIFVRWSKLGWDSAGTLHTHPGKLTTASSPDVKSWADMPGIHLIVAKSSEKVGVYTVVAGQVFPCRKQEITGELESMLICTPRGGRKWWKNLKEYYPMRSVMRDTVPVSRMLTDYYTQPQKVGDDDDRSVRVKSPWARTAAERVVALQAMMRSGGLVEISDAARDCEQYLAVPYADAKVVTRHSRRWFVFPISAIERVNNDVIPETNDEF